MEAGICIKLKKKEQDKLPWTNDEGDDDGRIKVDEEKT